MAVNLEELRSDEGLVVPVSSDPIAPQLIVPMSFTPQMLQNPLLCRSYIQDELTRVLGFRPRVTAIALLATQLVETAETERLNEDDVVVDDDDDDDDDDDEEEDEDDDDDDDFAAYNFEIAPVDETEIEDGDIIIEEYFDDEDDYLFDDEEVTSGTSTIAMEKLKAERFVGDEKEELGNCCVCLEEMCGGKEQLVGLPKCKHVYHENCILQWLENTDSCPLCRTPLED